ncbi:hypothetical protein [Faecalibacillus faecis]|uniref:hypothetical protein n=1 Tax=Faecalibacillus faecis TaxID=1982628 RepID=UPI002F94AE07
MMCIKERNASDSTCKKLLRDKGCFADLCNYAFFQGRQVIQPEELVSRENDLSTLIGNVEDPTEIKRYRDVVLNRKLNTSKNKIKLQNKIINRWNIMPL